ncbi:MAG: hypothetical protein K9L61_00625 [Candidatus Omnitrophica bacterium]|nr:hypothetical protein [Candidatus Omnitrophota bacterium]
MIIKNKRQRGWLRKSQAIIEYALVLIGVVAAFVTMGIYFQRSMQGKLRAHADDLGEQFSPDKTTATMTSTVVSNSTESTSDGETVVTSDQSQSISKVQTVDK